MYVNIPEEERERLEKKIPVLIDQLDDLPSYSFYNDVYDLVYESNLKQAYSCLSDAYNRINYSIFSFNEASLFSEWLNENDNVPHAKLKAVNSARFYLDYIPLLLYAAQEDISIFLLHILNLKNEFQSWKSNKSFNGKCNAERVGRFIVEDDKNTLISRYLIKMLKNNEWSELIKYRNKWVHDTYQNYDDSRIQINRKSNVRNVDGMKSISFGGGDIPDVTMDKMLKTCKVSLELIFGLVNLCIEMYKTENARIDKHQTIFKDVE